MRNAIVTGALGVALMGLMGAANGIELAWRERAPLPQPVAGYMGGVLHGHLYIIGGSYWAGKQKRWTDRVQVFDPAVDTWRPGPPLPQPESDAVGVSLDGAIYLFGGGEGDAIRRDALELRGDRWTPVPDAELPAPRLYANAAVEGGWVYLLGGLPNAHDYTSASTTFWRWRPGEKGWQSLPDLPGPGRINFAMASVGGEIYVFGGATGAGANGVRNLNDAYRYNPGTRRWQRLPDLPVANRSWWAVGLGHSALLLAGYTNDYASAVYRFIPGEGARAEGRLPRGLADIKFFRIGDRVVGTGGEAGPGIRGHWTMEAPLPRGWTPGTER